VKAFLTCGVLAHGFTRVHCEACGDESLVAFSCKGRSLCPSCSARRAHVTAAHLVDDLLPKAPYRQWTLSFPFRLRWVLVKTPRLLARLQRLLFSAIAVHQRRVARRRGLTGRLHTGAVVMTQYFGSALQLTPHFHGLVPDGVFTEDAGALRFEPLPPPTPEDVARLALRFVRRVHAVLEKAGVLVDLYPPGRVGGLPSGVLAAAPALGPGRGAAPARAPRPGGPGGGLLAPRRHLGARE
jgi:hypothetical protein